MMVMTRRTREDKVTLFSIDSRLMREQKLELEFDHESYRWRCLNRVTQVTQVTRTEKLAQKLKILLSEENTYKCYLGDLYKLIEWEETEKRFYNLILDMSTQTILLNHYNIKIEYCGQTNGKSMYYLSDLSDLSDPV